MTDYQQIYEQNLSNGKLCLQFCPVCNKFVFYPRERCPECFNNRLEWQPVSGEGSVHSYSIVNVSALPQFSAEVPYIYALVDLREGIRIATNLIDCQLDQLQINLPVKLALTKREGKTLPVFRPA